MKKRRADDAQKKLTEIAQDRPLTYKNVSFVATPPNFCGTPVWSVTRMEIQFENLQDRMLSWTVKELALELEGNKKSIPLQPNDSGFIHAKQPLGYGFDVQGLHVINFPLVLRIYFDFKYEMFRV